MNTVKSRDPRRIILFHKIVMTLFGMSGGLSFFTLVAVLTFRLSREGVSTGQIGLFALSGLPYSFRFFWPFLIDHAHIPWLSNLFGQRKAWGVVAQVFSILGFLFLGMVSPSQNFSLTFLLVLFTSFFSAVQDIVSDAYRFVFIKHLPLAQSVPVQTFGFRCGQCLAQSVVPVLAGTLGWFVAHLAVVLVKVLSLYALFRLPNPAHGDLRSKHLSKRRQVMDKISDVVRKTATKPFLFAFLSSIILLRCFDTILGPIQTIFVGKLGITNIEFGTLRNGIGFFGLMLGVVCAGKALHASRKSTLILHLLSFGMIGQAFASLLSLLLLHVSDYTYLLGAITFVQEFFQGFMNTLLVVYISSFCEQEIGIYHFTLFSAISSLSRTCFTSLFSALITKIGWTTIFFIPLFVCVPLMCMLHFLISKKLPLTPYHPHGSTYEA